MKDLNTFNQPELIKINKTLQSRIIGYIYICHENQEQSQKLYNGHITSL
jgi:hypothetical protein